MTVTGTPSETTEVRDAAPPEAAPPEAAPHASLRERKKLATRRLLRRAAINLVAERGLANVTVEDIAEAAEVSPRTFFNYFPSKEAVLFSGDPERTSALQMRIASFPPGPPPLEVLRTVLAEDAVTITEELRALGGDPQDWLRRMKEARQDPHVRAAQAGQMAMTERAIGEGLAARLGMDLEADLYPGLLAAVAVSAVRACISYWGSAGGSVQLSDLINRAFATLSNDLNQPEHDLTRPENDVNHRKDGH